MRNNSIYRISFYPPYKSQKIGTFKTGNRFKISLIRGRLKAIFYLLTKDFGPLWKFWKKTFV